MRPITDHTTAKQPVEITEGHAFQLVRQDTGWSTKTRSQGRCSKIKRLEWQDRHIIENITPSDCRIPGETHLDIKCNEVTNTCCYWCSAEADGCCVDNWSTVEHSPGNDDTYTRLVIIFYYLSLSLVSSAASDVDSTPKDKYTGADCTNNLIAIYPFLHLVHLLVIATKDCYLATKLSNIYAKIRNYLTYQSDRTILVFHWFLTCKKYHTGYRV